MLSGHFETWPELAGQLAFEGYAASIISRIGRDRAKQRALAVQLLEVAKAIEEGRLRKIDSKRMSPSMPISALARRR